MKDQEQTDESKSSSSGRKNSPGGKNAAEPICASKSVCDRTTTNINHLYREALAQAKKDQPLKIHNTPRSILLTAPNNIIFELFDSILKELTVDELNKFIETHLKSYLQQNWSNKTLQNGLAMLRRDQILDKRAGSPIGLPEIGQIIRQEMPTNGTAKETDQLAAAGSGGGGSGNTNGHSMQQSIEQVYEHIMWRIRNQRINQMVALILKFFVEDGYKRGHLEAQVFPDVAKNFLDWRRRLLIKLYAFGNLPANDQRLLLAHTSGGNLTNYVANYVDGSEKNLKPDLIKILAGALRDKTKNCIYISHDLDYSLKALNTGSIRIVLLLNRDQRYANLDELIGNNEILKGLILKGRIYILDSLDCVEFVPDPTSLDCC